MICSNLQTLLYSELVGGGTEETAVGEEGVCGEEYSLFALDADD